MQYWLPPSYTQHNGGSLLLQQLELKVTTTNLGSEIVLCISLKLVSLMAIILRLTNIFCSSNPVYSMYWLVVIEQQQFGHKHLYQNTVLCICLTHHHFTLCSYLCPLLFLHLYTIHTFILSGSYTPPPPPPPLPLMMTCAFILPTS